MLIKKITNKLKLIKNQKTNLKKTKRLLQHVLLN